MQVICLVSVCLYLVRACVFESSRVVVGGGGCEGGEGEGVGS